MTNKIPEPKRKSYMELGEIYFWTATINSWQYLLKDDAYKDIIISSFYYLSSKSIMDIFGFVILPNHLHLIWRPNRMNGRESGQGSFLKFTAHEFRRRLMQETPGGLKKFAVKAVDRAHEFWQRDSLAIPLFTKKVAFQKLNYIHNNPVVHRLKLAEEPCEYAYSSASYYELGVNKFEFLKDLRMEF